MNNDNKLVLSAAEGLIPKYRFPEFKNDGNWGDSNLKKIASITIGEFVIKSKQNPNSPYPVYNGGRSYTGFYDEYNNTENKIVISARGANAGFVNLVKQKFWGGNSCYAIDILNEKKHKLDYIYYFIKHNQRLFTENQHAANIPSVSKTDVEKFKILLPTNPAEQQKIAECLSSLDDVIAGYEEKLTALEEHKKGLMQNLFPQEGETQPKYRFPEFENDGDWVEKKLGDVANINPKISNLPSEFIYIDLESVKSGILYQKKKMCLEDAPSRAQRLLEDGDVIFQMVRPYQKNNYYFNKNDDFEYVASTGYAQMRALVSSKFLFQLIHTERFVTDVLLKCTGSSYPAINSSDLSNIIVQVPTKPKEQQKIASVLSSVDELIVAQREKIEALKTHKRGLMQGLFPKIES